MKYSSRKFPRLNEKEELLLYFMSILSLVQIFYLVMHRKYTFIILFFVIGIILSFFINNQAYILIFDIILINILMQTVKREGLENKGIVSEKSTPAIPISTEPDTKNKAHPKKAGLGVSKNATSVIAPTTLKPKENFTAQKKNGQIAQVSDHIQALNGLMDRFSSLTEKLGFNK
jgi:predicted signal transduction protein with EAL and GGDEF domain